MNVNEFKIGNLIAKVHGDVLIDTWVTDENIEEVTDNPQYIPMPLYLTFLYRMGFEKMGHVWMLSEKVDKGEYLFILENVKETIFILKVYLNDKNVADYKFINSVSVLQNILNSFLDEPIKIKD
jgi:hypothetical protein